MPAARLMKSGGSTASVLHVLQVESQIWRLGGVECEAAQGVGVLLFGEDIIRLTGE